MICSSDCSCVKENVLSLMSVKGAGTLKSPFQGLFAIQAHNRSVSCLRNFLVLLFSSNSRSIKKQVGAC